MQRNSDRKTEISEFWIWTLFPVEITGKPRNFDRYTVSGGHRNFFPKRKRKPWRGLPRGIGCQLVAGWQVGGVTAHRSSKKTSPALVFKKWRVYLPLDVGCWQCCRSIPARQPPSSSRINRCCFLFCSNHSVGSFFPLEIDSVSRWAVFSFLY